MEKSCPRCHSKLECLDTELSKCHCSQLTLEKDTLIYLEKTKYDCLCNPCLIHLNDMIIEAKNNSFTTSKDQLQEGLHYYYEGPYMVMTEFYHITRGYCCQSGCRHCAYGFNSL